MGMQKAIRLGLAVDESLTTSHIGAYINYRTAAYWLADDKGAGTVDLSQEASAKGAAAKAAKANQAASRPRARSASNCYTSNVAETLHGVAEEAIGSAASAVSRLRPGALAYDPNAAQAYDADTHPSRWTDERLRAYLRDAPGSHASVAARRNRIQSREQLVRPLALTLTHNPSPIPNPNPNPGPNQVRYACDAMRRAPPRAPPAADAAAAAAAATHEWAEARAAERVGGGAQRGILCVARADVQRERRLQPHVLEAATECAGGCNRMRWRLQPHVLEAATERVRQASAASANSPKSRPRRWRGGVDEAGAISVASSPLEIISRRLEIISRATAELRRCAKSACHRACTRPERTCASRKQ